MLDAVRLAGHRASPRSLHLPALPGRRLSTAASPQTGICSTTFCATPARPRAQRRDRRSRHRSGACAQPRRRGPARRLHGTPAETWQRDRARAADAPRHARRSARKTKETRHRRSPVDLDADRAASSVRTGIGFFDHMLEQLARHGGFSLSCTARATCTSTSTTPSRTARSRSARRCAQALGDKRGIGALRLPAADGRGAGAGGDRPVGPRRTSCSRAVSAREQVGGLPTELVPHFFRSLAESLGAAIHVERARREHAPHGRSLLQGRRPRAAPGRCAREGSELP